MKLDVMRALALVLGLVAACRHEDAPPPKLEPGETLPLPPASGTPIGFLLDDATNLSLKPEQIAQLQGIDQALQGRLESIDTQLRALEPHDPGQPAPAQGQGRHRGGGRRGGGGGAPTGQRVNHAPGAGGGSGARADDVNRLTEARKGEVKDALAKAFAVFDVPQRVLARKVLTEHDIDLDGGKPVAPPRPGDGDGDVPVEP